MVFTDGACRNNQDVRFRRAGYGAYWADGHHFNVSAALEGWCQTNKRLELRAVIAALETDARPLEIRTDSKYVFNGCTLHLAAWRASGWRRQSNADLWQRLDACLLGSPIDSVEFVKVKGHTKIHHVRSGLETKESVLTNCAADALATRGADSHEWSQRRSKCPAAKSLWHCRYKP